MVFATIGKAFLYFKTTKFEGIFIRVLEATVFASRLFGPVSYSGLYVPVKIGLRICASYALWVSGKSTPRFFKASLWYLICISFLRSST